MHMRRTWGGSVLLSLLFTLLLAGCSSGGGDSGNDAPAAAITGTAEGLWTGRTGDGRTVIGAVLDDDTYWFLYSLPGQPSEFAGMFQGHGLSRNGAFISSDGIDFHVNILDPPGLGGDATVTGSYLPRQTLSGILAYNPLNGGGTATFTGTYVPAYEETPDLTQIAGVHTGLVSVGYSPNPGRSVIIAPSGRVCFVDGPLQTVDAIFGTPLPLSPFGNYAYIYDNDRSCTMLGTLAPRAQGNLYDLVMIHHYGPRISRNPDVYQFTATYTGIVFVDRATNRLYGLAVEPDRLTAFLFVGTKP